VSPGSEPPRAPLGARPGAWLGGALWLGFAAQLAALDVWVRGASAYAARPRMLGGLVGSVALCGLVASLVRRRAWRIVLSLGLGSLVVAQLAYYRYYHAPLDAQVVTAARQAWSDVRPMLLHALPVLGAGIAVVAMVEYGVLCAIRPPRLPRLALLAAGLGGFLWAGSARDATLEIRAVQAIGRLGLPREPQPGGNRRRLPEIESTRERLPNVLVVLTESVRASDACQARGCPTSPEIDQALPKRVSFTEARAVSSYSWLALSAITTGRSQVGPRAEIANAPDIFDWARAARTRDARYSLHYWSAQLGSALERGDLGQTVEDVVTAETLLGHAATDIEDSVAEGLDRQVARLCERSLDSIPKPAFVVVHLAGTHAPYYFAETDAPYQPWQRQVTWSGLDRLHAAYLNAIREQDRSVAACIRAFLDASSSAPWLVVYSSDHGEAFGEHTAIHHGQNLYDEQLRVPLLVAHGSGALSEAQAQALRDAAPRFVTHLDLAPTLLDALGLLDHFALSASVTRLPGRSLLRPLTAAPALPITNCTELYACPINTWGMLDEGRKLVAQAWDGNWRCLSLVPEEHERDLGACADLVLASRSYFPELPNGAPNRP
jgi:hypothetical protein